MTEVIISGILLFLLVAINKKLRRLINYLIAILLAIAIPFAIHFLLPENNVDYLTFFAPAFFLILFQIVRQLFLRLRNQEMIFYMRGIYLSSEEKEIVSYIDIIASICMIFIPIVLTIWIHFM